MRACVVHLGELKCARLYREYACASMFAYCVEELHMSEAERICAFRRV